MHYAHGATRWVFIGEKYAVKVARIRPLGAVQFFLRQRRRLLAKKQSENFYPSLILKTLKYLVIGIIANAIEARLYRDYGDSPDLNLAPTIFSSWLINIQIRGKPITKAESADGNIPIRRWSYLYMDYRDLWDLNHYVKIGEKICFVDYGGPYTDHVIRLHCPQPNRIPGVC